MTQEITICKRDLDLLVKTFNLLNPKAEDFEPVNIEFIKSPGAGYVLFLSSTIVHNKVHGEFKVEITGDMYD